MGVITTIENWEVTVDFAYTTYEYVPGEIYTPNNVDKSWTMSYSLKDESWTSNHSYLPYFYLHYQDDFYSWVYGNSNLWKHAKPNSYGKYYGVQNAFIIEYAVVSAGRQEVIWDEVEWVTYARRFDNTNKGLFEERFITFNKLIAYNTRQCTGLLNLKVKDLVDGEEDYLLSQVEENPNETRIDKTEQSWNL